MCMEGAQGDGWEGLQKLESEERFGMTLETDQDENPV